MRSMGKKFSHGLNTHIRKKFLGIDKSYITANMTRTANQQRLAWSNGCAALSEGKVRGVDSAVRLLTTLLMSDDPLFWSSHSMAD